MADVQAPTERDDGRRMIINGKIYAFKGGAGFGLYDRWGAEPDGLTFAGKIEYSINNPNPGKKFGSFDEARSAARDFLLRSCSGPELAAVQATVERERRAAEEAAALEAARRAEERRLAVERHAERERVAAEREAAKQAAAVALRHAQEQREREATERAEAERTAGRRAADSLAARMRPVRTRSALVRMVAACQAAKAAAATAARVRAAEEARAECERLAAEAAARECERQAELKAAVAAALETRRRRLRLSCRTSRRRSSTACAGRRTRYGLEHLVVVPPDRPQPLHHYIYTRARVRMRKCHRPVQRQHTTPYHTSTQSTRRTARRAFTHTGCAG